MKFYLLPLLALPCFLYAQKNAQKEIPDFGKIEKSDLLLKECEYDKDAEAYKLLDLGYLHYERNTRGFETQMDIRERIKILNEKGLENANIKIAFKSAFNRESISGISAITYNLDGSGNVVTTRLDKGSIFTKKINNRYSEITFTLPEVKVGSVIEYKYTDIRQQSGDVSDWYFQDDIPVRLSQYKVLVPEMLKFATQVLTYQPVEQSSSETYDQFGSGNAAFRFRLTGKSYTVRNIPALKDEPFMGSAQDYRQRIEFQLSRIDYPNGQTEQIMSNWPQVSRELLEDEDFGMQMKKNIPRTKDLDILLKGINDDYTKMKIIYDYVRKNMNWNSGESFYTTEGVKAAWDKKSGTNSEINLILLNLLKDAGLKARPILVSTRDNGTVNPMYPFLGQFNNVLAYVPIGNNFYVLNGADKYNPAGLIPYDVINTEGFVVDKDSSAWVTLSNNNQIYKNTVFIFAAINDSSVMEGNATVNSYDYSKNPRVKKWKASKESFGEYFTKDYSGIKIDSLNVSNADNDSLPLEQKIQFRMPVNSSGDYKYFTVNLFDGLEKNPFIADHRSTDIEFGYNQFYSINGTIMLPENYTVEELPKNISLITPDTSIVLRRLLQLDGDALGFRVTLEFKKPSFPARDYEDFKAFYKTLYDKLNEQIVIKKKTS